MVSFGYHFVVFEYLPPHLSLPSTSEAWKAESTGPQDVLEQKDINCHQQLGEATPPVLLFE